MAIDSDARTVGALLKGKDARSTASRKVPLRVVSFLAMELARLRSECSLRSIVWRDFPGSTRTISGCWHRTPWS